MDFGVNKTSIEVIKERAFWDTFSREIYSSVNGKWYKKSRKEFDQLKNIDQKYYAQVIMMLVLINMVLSVEHRYDFGKIKAGLIKYTLMHGFSGILDTG